MDEKIMIGLETHVQLNTSTKLFCGCKLDGISTAEPNTRTCVTCLGMPGSKPRINSAALDAALKIALALSCKIADRTYFSRKTYLYPDMSKNFQITQYEIPLAQHGISDTLDSEGKTKNINIQRIHIEEDPAKMQHIGGDITTANYVLVDYNRSGIPLVEIVTAPEFKNPREARVFLQRLMAILQYLGVFIADELTIKSDANISLAGGERVEIKNIGGFRELERALNYEIIRQRGLIRRGQKIERETRAWDSGAKVTRRLRGKEFEEDYGYIFEPDLTPIKIKKDHLEKLSKQLPELPVAKLKRYIKEFKISEELAAAITGDIELAQFYEKIVAQVEPKFSATWMNILKKTLFWNNLSLSESKLTLNLFVKLLKLVQNNELSDRGAELVLREIVTKPEQFEELAARFSTISEKDLAQAVAETVKTEKMAVSAYRSGEDKALQFLIGQVIKRTRKRADARVVRELLIKELK